MPQSSGGQRGPSSRDTGSQRALRGQNMDKVLRSLALHGPQSQAELARGTGLSAGTISNIVRALSAADRVTCSPILSSGRRATQVTLAPDSRLVVGLDVGRSHMSLLLSDVARRTRGYHRLPLEFGHTPAETFELASRTLDEVLAREGIARDRIVSAGVAVAASVAPVTGRVVQATALPRWANQPLADVSEKLLGVPTVLANDADLGALANATFGRTAGVHTLAYVKLATGIGLGLTIDSQLYRSTSGLAGEIGHFQVMEGGDICICGRRGCLETVASTRRVLADLSSIKSGTPVTVEDVIASTRAGDPTVLGVLDDVGTAIGQTLALVCNMLAPDLLVFGGSLSPAGTPILAAIERSVLQRALPAVANTTRFALSDLGERDEVLGACALALQGMAPREG